VILSIFEVTFDAQLSYSLASSIACQIHLRQFIADNSSQGQLNT